MSFKNKKLDQISSSALDETSVLFVDDDTTATNVLIRSLNRKQPMFQSFEVNNANSAIQFVKLHQPSVAIVDLSLNQTHGPESGLSLISELIALDSSLRILVLTGHGAEEFGLKALQYGAASFLNKPADVNHLLALINDGISYSKLKRQYHALVQQSTGVDAIHGFSSRSKAMKPVLENLAYTITNKLPVLLIGETGTGKGVMAHAIHQSSLQKKGAFIRFQPSYGSLDMVSSEIFGHQKGAFTGATDNREGLIEAANGGTFFIDEVDELPQETQIMLLNVLQEKVFRRIGSNKDRKSEFRLITASNRKLGELLDKKKLRQDFYHRIAHILIEIPALRDRAEDIPDLADTFLKRITNRENLPIQGLSSQALAHLCRYSWPGNIRELQSTIEAGAHRAYYHQRRFIEVEDLSLNRKKSGVQAQGSSFREKVKNYEFQLVYDALARHNNNQTEAAQSLQVDRSTLRRIIKKYQN